MATVNVRIDDNVKADAQKVLDDIGLSMSNAVSIYFKQIALHKAIPFKLSADPVLEPTDELKALLAEVREDIKNDRNLSPAMDRDETLAYLKDLRG